MIRLLGRLLLFLSLMCAGLSPAMATERAPLVLAAASLQESLTAAADAWAAKGHARPVLSFAGSSALARPIEAGAPADLFISADEGWMDYVAQKGMTQPQTRTSFLANRLVLIAPVDSRAKVKIHKGFARARLLGIGGGGGGGSG